MNGRGRHALLTTLLNSQRSKATGRQICLADGGQGFEKAFRGILFMVDNVIRPVLPHRAYSSGGSARILIRCNAGRDRTNERLVLCKSAAYSCHVETHYLQYPVSLILQLGKWVA